MSQKNQTANATKVLKFEAKTLRQRRDYQI